jgi:hypothetical protein
MKEVDKQEQDNGKIFFNRSFDFNLCGDAGRRQSSFGKSNRTKDE